MYMYILNPNAARSDEMDVFGRRYGFGLSVGFIFLCPRTLYISEHHSQNFD